MNQIIKTIKGSRQEWTIGHQEMDSVLEEAGHLLLHGGSAENTSTQVPIGQWPDSHCSEPPAQSIHSSACQFQMGAGDMADGPFTSLSLIKCLVQSGHCLLDLLLYQAEDVGVGMDMGGAPVGRWRVVPPHPRFCRELCKEPMWRERVVSSSWVWPHCYLPNI